MIAEMIAAHVAAEVAELKAIRPVSPSLYDQYPNAVYETEDLRNKRYLNCASKRYDGTIRFYVVAEKHADVTSVCERMKDVLLEYRETGEVYRIRRMNLVDEGDVGQEITEQGQTVYVKSLDFTLVAEKLT